MKQIIFLTILALVFSVSAFAQTEKSPCPEIDVSGGGVVSPGEPIYFTANVQGVTDDSKIEYIWTVSAGKIIEGLGTPTIKVDRSGSSEMGLTATVEIKGLPENCANTASESYYQCIILRPKWIDEFGKLLDSQVNAKVENIFAELANEPNSQGYITNYGTDKEIARRERQIQKAVVSLKLESSRVTIVRGGANPNGAGVWTKVWIVPPGADNPQP